MAGSELRSQGRKGLIIVYTGDGKGKTTAAMGLLMRAWGQGLRVCVIQFIKNEGGKWGEYKTAQKLGIEWHKYGDGFTWLSKDMDETVALARQGWELAQEKIAGGAYDLVVLDEFTYALAYDWLEASDALAWLKANRPAGTHVVITGRQAPDALLEAADLVTEMKLVRHPYENGVRAQAGIEF
jgi:cob(I)alamin adenosyltransferase